MKKISVIGATLVAAVMLCAAPISLQLIPRQRFVIVRKQGGSRCRAAANTRKCCWRPPQTSQACM